MLLKKKVHDLDRVEQGIRASFEAVKEEMTNHLDSINQNTDEIQGLYDYLAELDSKMTKISERLEEVEMLINPCMEALSCDLKLTRKEKDVFMVLYTEDKATNSEIAYRSGLTGESVTHCIYSLIAKGIPIVKESIGQEVHLSLNSRFKEMQAKKNILDLGPELVV